MQLQDQLLNHLTELIKFGSRIRTESNITELGRYALDATEKNGSVPDSLMAHINQVAADLGVERERISQILALPEGSTTGDAELIDIRLGVDGTQYKSAGEAVRSQIEKHHDVYVGSSKPATKPKMWIDTSLEASNTEFWVPEVKDDEVSYQDTWSSARILEAIAAANRDIYVGAEYKTATKSGAKIWIDTNSGEEFFVPEINDEEISAVDTWSSQKIAAELEKIREEFSIAR